MKQNLQFICISLILTFFYSFTHAQSDVKVKLVEEQKRNFTNYYDFNNFFLQKEKAFGDSQNRYYLYSVDSWGSNSIPKKPSYFRISDEFLLPQMTNIVGIAFNPLQNKQNNINLWVGGRIGTGAGNSKEDHIQNIVGGEIEFEYFPAKNISLFSGISINRTSIKDFNESVSPADSLSMVDGAGLFELFAGARYYFDTPQANAKIGLHVKVGMNFWNDINDFSDFGSTSKYNSNDYYVGLGVGITSLKPLGRIGTPTFIAPETELNFSPVLNTYSAKLSQPIRFLDGFSAALTGNLGYGFGHPIFYEVDNISIPNSLELTNTVGKFAGFGVDLRFFDYDLNSYVNPYIGWNINFYSMDDIDELPNVINPTFGSFISLGNKIRISNSNWFVDLRASVAFWEQISDYQRDSLGLAMSFPSPIDFNIGIGYKFNNTREKRIKNYSANYKIYDAKDYDELLKLSKVQSEEYVPLETASMKPVNLAEKVDSVFEERVYIRKDPEINITKTEIIKFPNFDVTDIKFFRVSFRFALEMNMFSPDLFEEMSPAAESTEILVAMFNKNRIDVEKLTDLNMYLHFNDLDSSRYFGYRYDESRQLQPEVRELYGLQRDSKTAPVYYGKYDEFVKHLKWIDKNEFILQNLSFPGSRIQDNAFNQISFHQADLGANQVSGPNEEEVIINSSNYRLAYTIYPRETLQAIDEACKNFGVSILFRHDLDDDMDKQDPLNGHFTDGQFIDKNDAAFFSNVVNGSNIYDPEKDGCRTTIQLTDFRLGSAELIPNIHYPQLQKAAELANLCNISIFIGFTDSVEFNNPSFSMDKFISDFTNINFENQLIRVEFDKIVNEWTKFEAGETNLSSNEICQKALAFRRINSVVDALKTRFKVDANLIEVAPIGIWPNNKERRNPKARRVEIRFTQR